MEKYKDKSTRYMNFTTRDNNRLQVLQNQVNRILTGANKRTSTLELLTTTNTLSVQQMIALQTLILTYKIIQTKKPAYLADKIKFDENVQNLRSKSVTLKQVQYRLNQSREGFVYRGILLFNKMEENIRKCETIEAFKKGARKWVLENIPIKP